MTWKWPKLDAVGTTHTVDTPRGRRAGLLIRSKGGAELGHVWAAGTDSGAWFWRTPDGHHGERSSQSAAVKVLRDAYDLRGSTTPRLPFDDTTPAVHKNVAPMQQTCARQPVPTRRRAPKKDDVGPRIQWAPQVGDLTAAMSAALKRHSRDEGK